MGRWSRSAIGLVGALGILSSQSAILAVLAMALIGAAAGYCFAVSLRLAIHGLSIALALVISQGLFLSVSDADAALLYGTAGGLAQALCSLIVWLLADRAADDLAVALCLSISAALAFGLLTVQYALFSAAITTYVVLLTDTPGESAIHAAGQRPSGTAIGIAIAFLAFLAWPNPGEGRELSGRFG